MTDFIPAHRTEEEEDGPEPLLDAFLREALPEAKLALGDLIDRDNTRAIPGRYVKLLPTTTLVVAVRPDVARAIASIAAELEDELTDSVMRHGSLYDREYRVRLKEAGQAGAPLFRVSTQPPDAPEPERIEPAPPTPPAPAPPPRREPAAHAGSAGTLLEGGRPEPMDPDATRVEGGALPPFPTGRFAVVVEQGEDGEQQRFALDEPVRTLGRETDDPSLRSDLQLAGSPSVSRRQLALVWSGAGGEPAFDVYNLGLNPLHVGEREIPGANAGRGPLKLDGLDAHSVRVLPGEPIRIGGHGPVVRIVDTEAGTAGGEPPDDDPDRTRFG
jgi:hypothetical protein